ncbi:MAG TPA: hypothetical protein VIC08_15215 [Cellvibrionaceae bacterium]
MSESRYYLLLYYVPQPSDANDSSPLNNSDNAPISQQDTDFYT